MDVVVVALAAISLVATFRVGVLVERLRVRLVIDERVKQWCSTGTYAATCVLSVLEAARFDVLHPPARREKVSS